MAGRVSSVNDPVCKPIGSQHRVGSAEWHATRSAAMPGPATTEKLFSWAPDVVKAIDGGRGRKQHSFGPRLFDIPMEAFQLLALAFHFQGAMHQGKAGIYSSRNEISHVSQNRSRMNKYCQSQRFCCGLMPTASETFSLEHHVRKLQGPKTNSQHLDSRNYASRSDTAVASALLQAILDETSGDFHERLLLNIKHGCILNEENAGKGTMMTAMAKVSAALDAKDFPASESFMMGVAVDNKKIAQEVELAPSLA